MPLLNLNGLFQGLVTYSSEKSGRDTKRNLLQQEINLSENRKQLYLEVQEEAENLAQDLDEDE